MKRKAANNTTDRASNRVRSGTLFRGTAPNFESIPTRKALKGTPKKDGKGGERVTQRKSTTPPLNTSRQSAAALRLQSAARRAMAEKEYRKRLYEYVLLLRKLYMENEISNHALSKIFLKNGNLDVFAAKRLPAKHPFKKLQLKLIDLYKRRNLVDLIEKEMSFGGVAANERIPGHILKGAKDSARDVETLENLTSHLLEKTNANTNLAQRVLDHLKNSYEQRTLMNERTFQNLNKIPKLNDLKNRTRIAKNIAKFSHDDHIPDKILKGAKDSARDVKTVEDLTSHLFQAKDANKNLAQRVLDHLKKSYEQRTNERRFRLIDNRANEIAQKIMFNTTNGNSSDSDDFDNSLRLLYRLHRLEKNDRRRPRGQEEENAHTKKKKIHGKIRHSITKDKRLMMRMAPETVVYGKFGHDHEAGHWKDPERIVNRALIHPTAKKQRTNVFKRRTNHDKEEGFTSKSVHDIRIDESYGNSALPSKAEGRSIGKGRPYSGKARVPSNPLTLYHVTKKQPLNFKAGDAIEFKGNSFWHSDPGFKWMGRGGGVVRGGLQGGLFQGTFAPRGRAIPKSVIKLIVPSSPLPKGLVRSTNVHNTNFGTTFKLAPTLMYIASNKLLHNSGTKELTAYIIPDSSWFDRSTPDYSPETRISKNEQERAKNE